MYRLMSISLLFSILLVVDCFILFSLTIIPCLAGSQSQE